MNTPTAPEAVIAAGARTATVTRNTAETKITVHVNLDGTGKANLSTGIGFFDHMLDQIARHGLIDLDIDVDADDRGSHGERQQVGYRHGLRNVIPPIETDGPEPEIDRSDRQHGRVHGLSNQAGERQSGGEDRDLHGQREPSFR